MSEGKLYIVITDKASETDIAAATGSTPTTGIKKDSEKSFGKYAQHRFFNFIESQAKQFVSYGINNIGNFTGDYILQRQVNEAVQAVDAVTNIGMAALAGAKFGVPGAAIGAGIAVAGLVTNRLFEVQSQWLENRKTNYNIQQLRNRSGLNNYRDGSRGTEN